MSINLILGPMFSGKSTELLRRYRRYTIGKKKCLLVKTACDNRYDADKLCTHDEIGETAVRCSTLKELQTLVDVTKYDVICIDEVQFLPDAVEELDRHAHFVQ
jgi:thymidine kinase